jgi:predicted phage-related endonuclease
MARTKVKRQFAVDADFEVQTQIERYKQLREWIKRAEAEKDQLSEKLVTKMDEHHAEELTVKGVPVVSLVDYPREDVDQKRLKLEHPRIWTRFKKITRVRFPRIP